MRIAALIPFPDPSANGTKLIALDWLVSGEATSKDALDYASRIDTKIVLIDGQELAQMLN